MARHRDRGRSRLWIRGPRCSRRRVDTPCYTTDSSAKARPCAEFVVGDGGTMPNLGQKTLNLSSDMAEFPSVFQIAPVHRALEFRLISRVLRKMFATFHCIQRENDARK